MDRYIDLAGQALHLRGCSQHFPTRAGLFEERIAIVSRQSAHLPFDPPERTGQVLASEC
jgi:hypothetical protein